MKSQHKFEFIVGLFVIIGLLAFAFLAIRVSGLSNFNRDAVYHITAAFENIGDLKVRAPVTIGGVKVGRVTAIQLNPETYQAIVSMEIDQANKYIPQDSTASIYTAGLIGANYISITPGFDELFLKDGDEIQNTNQALILQNLIGQLMFKLNNDKKNNTQGNEK